jgi:hypothetical protein
LRKSIEPVNYRTTVRSTGQVENSTFLRKAQQVKDNTVFEESAGQIENSTVLEESTG